MRGGSSEPFRQLNRGSEENVTAGDITEEAVAAAGTMGEKLNVGSNVTSHMTHDNKVRGNQHVLILLRNAGCIYATWNYVLLGSILHLDKLVFIGGKYLYFAKRPKCFTILLF